MPKLRFTFSSVFVEYDVLFLVRFRVIVLVSSDCFMTPRNLIWTLLIESQTWDINNHEHLPVDSGTCVQLQLHFLTYARRNDF